MALNEFCSMSRIDMSVDVGMQQGQTSRNSGEFVQLCKIGKVVSKNPAPADEGISRKTFISVWKRTYMIPLKACTISW